MTNCQSTIVPAGSYKVLKNGSSRIRIMNQNTATHVLLTREWQVSGLRQLFPNISTDEALVLESDIELTANGAKELAS
jgi:hypothetical protein